MFENETKQTNEFDETTPLFSEDGELDLDSSDEDDFDPFDGTDFPDEPAKKPEPEKEPPATNKPEPKPSPAQTDSPANPLEKAMDAAENKDAKESQKSLIAKPPVFSYAAANEEITDTSKTFEELRIEKASDFPEFEDGKRVSWTVEYGKIIKPVSTPKSTTIAKMKTDIETSREFLEALKKAKDKEPACKVIPKITAQSKGKVSAYKGVYTSVEEARASGKLITLFPAKNGNVYEMRKNEMGTFITHAIGSDMLSEVKAGFNPALPLIGADYLMGIIHFFKFMALKGNFEVLFNIYWDKEERIFICDIPNQYVTPFSVEAEPNPEYEADRYIHYMDIHSHNRMNAYFSETDNKDEKATRVYAVIGNVFSYFPDIKVRISNGGKYLEIDPGLVFDGISYNTCYDSNQYSRIKMKCFEDKKNTRKLTGCDSI